YILAHHTARECIIVLAIRASLPHARKSPATSPRDSKKTLNAFSWKSLLVSLSLAFLAGAATCAVWRAGLIDSLQAGFVVNVGRGETPMQTPQTWLGLLLIVGVSMSAGFLVSRAGARRSFWILGLGFLVTAAASLLSSRYLK